MYQVRSSLLCVLPDGADTLEKKFRNGEQFRVGT
jgi:hypothetical protein